MGNWYEEKQEARRERLEARAERKRAEGEARLKQGRDAMALIPFGQPILIGHHSEKRDRNYRNRAHNNMGKGFELQKEAASLEARAANVGKAGISSDDPDAPEKLKERIAKLEALQERMAATNKLIRKFAKDRAEFGPRNTLLALEQMGYLAGTAGKLLTPDYAGRIGFPSYELTNNSANLRRLKLRLAQVERLAVKREEAETVEEMVGEVRVVENREINRLQLFFPGKPDAETRSRLKSYGFRWSPSEGAWQRQLGASAKWAASTVLEAK